MSFLFGHLTLYATNILMAVLLTTVTTRTHEKFAWDGRAESDTLSRSVLSLTA